MKEMCRIGLKGSGIKSFKILPKGFIFRHLFWRHLGSGEDSDFWIYCTFQTHMFDILNPQSFRKTYFCTDNHFKSSVVKINLAYRITDSKCLMK